MSATYGLFGAAVVLDTLGTTLFKLGARPASSPTPVNGLLIAVLPSQWTLPHWCPRWQILLGLAVYALEYVLWLTYLSHSPLSQAFPMYSLTIVLILLVSKLFLNESVGLNRWCGAMLIIAGVWLCGGAT